MVTTNLIVLALTCVVVALAIPPQPLSPKTTIFGDEMLEGGIFEDVDAFTRNDIALYNEDNPYRLPTTTKPERYTILWATDFTTMTFAGTVTIALFATEANVNEIVIHSQDLLLLNLALTLNNVAVPFTYTTETEYDFLRIQITNGVLTYNAANPVIYELTISFEAPLRNDMYGIYRSWFKTGTETKWMASTQFQATSARKAFPCYDEPSFKAYFDITLRRPSAYRSWSNTRISTTANSTVSGYEDDVYFTTPYMSTYLIAIIVAEYDSLDIVNAQNQITYDVIARPDAISTGQGQYALEVGQELLAMMSNHTGIDFYSVDPNIKMTQASIPDFSAGAMENWGLLTYREAYLMYDENHTNSYFKQLIAYILSHEIAHMWFGNLVTCEWWDVLWLNEGFARYYQYFLTHWVEEYMGLETRFITEQVHTSLLSDSADNPHPLTNPGVGSPAAVSAMFSTLTYNKGAAVIRMTEHLLGFEVNRIGLSNYLTQRYSDTADPIHLFQALQDAGTAAGALNEYGTGFSLIEYYESWTEVAGHPVLNVQVNHDTGDMTIQQRRFNINSGYSSIETNWIVPITFSTASNPDFDNTKPTHIISDSISVINRGSIGDEWVIFNKQQTGFYRVNYDDYTWDLIVLALRGSDRTLIHEFNRAQIVNDVFQFARSGLMTYTRAFNILSFLEFETEYAPWVAAMTGFSWIRGRLAGTPYLEEFEAMIIQWATTVMNQLTYYPIEGETFMQSYLRYQLAPVMCAMGVSACREAAVAQYSALRLNNAEVPVDSRNWVYCNALREGTTEDFDFLWNRFQNHNVYTEKITILMSIGCTPHQVSINTYLNGIVLDNELIRPQDYTTAYNTAVSGNEGNTQIVFQFLQDPTNLQNAINAFGNAATPLSYVSARLRSEADITAFQTWATNNQALLGNSYTAVYNGAENSRVALQWATAVSNDLTNYIVNGNDDLDTTTAAAVTVPDAVTVPQPILVEPEIADSAVTAFVSVFAVVFAIAANLFV